MLWDRVTSVNGKRSKQLSEVRILLFSLFLDHLLIPKTHPIDFSQTFPVLHSRFSDKTVPFKYMRGKLCELCFSFCDLFFHS